MVRWEYLVFSPTITNTCPKRGTFAGLVAALPGADPAASRPAHAAIVIIRAAAIGIACSVSGQSPCGQNVKHSMRLPISGMPSRGGAGGPVALPPAAWLLGPPGVD